jgi:Lar family restriction alleviation protein
MNEELKPCPFCGGKPVVFETVESLFYKHSYRIGCKKEFCMVKPTTEHYITKEAVITAWNTRKE